MTIKATIYRGEVRRAYPTHTHPDPSEHLAADPLGFMKTWMAPSYPYPENYHGAGAVTTGQHWSRSPEIMPHRFTEGAWNKEQTGVAMGKPEARAIKVTMHAESEPPEGVGWQEHMVATAKSESARRRYEKQGVNIHADLSGGDPDRPGKAKLYRMGVIWHGEMPDEYEHGTDFEDEVNLPIGSHVRVTGARLFIPKTGVIQSHAGEQHPSTFTPEEHLAASLDARHRSVYSYIEKTSAVPWNRIQFPEPVDVPVEGHKYWSR